MRKSKEKHKLQYSFAIDGEDVMLVFKNTGMEEGNKDHKKFIDILCGIVAPQMYAKAKGIKPEDVKY